MSGFIVGADRNQATLFPELLDDYVAEESAVRLIDVFVDELGLLGLGFKTIAADITSACPLESLPTQGPCRCCSLQFLFVSTLPLHPLNLLPHEIANMY